MKINCDIGERGIDNEIDTELMKFIDIANIACGGHAGNLESVSRFRDLAQDNGVAISAHLSYPDRENFGRKSIDISRQLLLDSLSQQHQLLPSTQSVKFHGALYNDTWYNHSLSEVLTEWLAQQNVTQIICPDNSTLAHHCRLQGISVLSEAFAERRYNFNSFTKQLSLLKRTHNMASIDNCEDALKQIRDIKSGQILASIDSKAHYEKKVIKAQTICIHSDSSIALELARSLHA